MHDYHEAQPGYSENQVLHDGCAECKERSERSDGGISSMDRTRFARAWARAAEWNRAGLPDIARAEMPALNILWSVQLKLESYGFPIGVLPRD